MFLEIYVLHAIHIHVPGLFALLGVCSAGTEGSVTSLVDVISPQDQARIVRALQAAQPYDDLRTAYLIVRAVQALGFSDANKQVSGLSSCSYLIYHFVCIKLNYNNVIDITILIDVSNNYNIDIDFIVSSCVRMLVPMLEAMPRQI